MRLVTTGMADAKGRLKGALQIDLKPGWKTYWRDPGQAGIPPSLDVSQSSGVTGAVLDFPAPKRIDDGFADTAGYDQRVSLPVTFTLNGQKEAGPIRARAFLGLCKSICIPLQAELDVDPAAAPYDETDAGIVEAAEAALPDSASSEFHVTQARLEGKSVIIEARLPKGVKDVQLFLASGGGYLFGLPDLESLSDNTARFTAEVYEKPERAPASSTLFDYTLVADEHAVDGRVGID